MTYGTFSLSNFRRLGGYRSPFVEPRPSVPSTFTRIRRTILEKGKAGNIRKEFERFFGGLLFVSGLGLYLDMILIQCQQNRGHVGTRLKCKPIQRRKKCQRYSRTCSVHKEVPSQHCRKCQDETRKCQKNEAEIAVISTPSLRREKSEKKYTYRLFWRNKLFTLFSTWVRKVRTT